MRSYCVKVCALALLLRPDLAIGDNLDVVNPILIEKQLDAVAAVPKSEFAASSKPEILKEEIPEAVLKLKMMVKKVIFTHGSVYAEPVLQKLTAKYINREILLGDLYKLAADITRLYREDGYLLSRAVIPPQRIGADGIVHIQIVEGFVDAIIYEGELQQLSDKAKAVAAKIKDSRPLNSRDLERSLLLMRDLPGLQIESVLKPSATQPQASDLVIILKRKKINLALSSNNEGSKYVGPYMANLVLAVNSPFGDEDQFIAQAARVRKSKQLKHWHVMYHRFVGTAGTKLTLGGSWTKTRPGKILAVLGVIKDAKSLNFAIQYPLLRSRSSSLYCGLNFIIQNARSGFFGQLTATKDKLRIISADLTWDVADRWRGINLVHLEISQGLTGFGSTKNSYAYKSRQSGHPDFTRINLEASRLQMLAGNFSLYALLEGQYALSPLLSSERFSYGDSSNFKAYRDAPLSGDTGLKGKMELRYARYFESPVLQSYQVYGFYSYGTVWNKKISLDEHKRTSAPGIGAGLRLLLLKNVNFNLEYDQPLRTKIGLNKNHGMILFNISKKF
jgi:hemolysin activation/secretion protein